MSLINILKKCVNEKFINAQVEGTGKLAPRPGYYFIRSIEMQPIGVFDTVPIALVNWKSEFSNPFFESITFEIAITSLYSSEPVKTENLILEDLIGTYVCISSANLVDKPINGTIKKSLTCAWHFMDKQPEFIKTQNLISQSFGTIYSKHYYQNLIDTSPYDVLEALNQETNYGQIMDIPIEEWAYTDDYPIEDLNDDDLKSSDGK